MDSSWHNAITDVPGILVGHAQDVMSITGCTVVIYTKGAAGGVDVRGGAPGTRETDLLRPLHMVREVHAVLLSGGSAFGLAAADGVMLWLEEQGAGLPVGNVRVPIVPAAVIYDLDIGSSAIRPGAPMGYAACLAAKSGPIMQGSIGAGTGARIGSLLGPAGQMKGGLGAASRKTEKGLIVGALFVVNCLGDVVDPYSGAVIAGARTPDGAGFVDSLAVLEHLDSRSPAVFSAGQSTVIGVIATNACLSKEEANKVCQMAHDGLGRVIRPAHTMFDGDTIFALATGDMPADVNLVGALAAETTAAAIINGVTMAASMGGLPAYRDIQAIF